MAGGLWTEEGESRVGEAHHALPRDTARRRGGRGEMNVLFEEFLSRIYATDTVRNTWTALLAFLKPLGFELMMYGYASGKADVVDDDVETISNFPADYQDRYRKEHYCRHDPVVFHCLDHFAPLLVGRDAVHCWPDHGLSLTSVQRNIVNEAAACGMVSGVVIPLRSPGRYPIAGMSLSNAMSLREFERLMAGWGNVVQLAVLHGHTRLQMQLHAVELCQRDVELTPRERECLLWASRGLSAKEIAQRLRLSPRTVDFHVANAMTKLHAASRAQAVARAVALGLVTP